MTALQFEESYRDEWTELEGLLAMLPQGAADWRRFRLLGVEDPQSSARLPELYRRACGHLALARARAYPLHLIDRLEALTAEAHQHIYHRRDVGWRRFMSLIGDEVPKAVRTQAKYVLAATVAFVVPLVVMGVLVHRQSELILSMVSPDTAEQFEVMYSPAADALGRTRTAETDWTMFGFYIRNNVGVAFQCFAGGLFAGVGSIFFLAYNGAFAGALGGYLMARGLSPQFFSFVATHSAFELTAIVLSGAAGMRMGYGLIAPGRLTRTDSLMRATREGVVLVYGATVMLLIAAAVEAFWSSARWMPLALKYSVAVVCWAAVIGYLARQGRRAA